MIARESLHTKVVRHIALRILAGELSALPNEGQLGKELKVSRSILRESVKALAAKGLVEVGPTGTRVRPRTDWNLLDSQLLEWQSESEIGEHFFNNLWELRHILEPKAAELAALRATKRDIEEIQSAWQEMQLSAGNGRESFDREAFVAADLRFHYAILRASHNELFYQVGGLTRVSLRKSFSLMLQTPRRISYQISITLRRHKEILDGIAVGDQMVAKRTMERVIVAATTDLTRALGDRMRRPSAIKKRANGKVGKREVFLPS
jgi:DNA-binding FadR family transcriptional regulator